MFEIILLVIIGLLMFKLSGGLSRLFAVASRILGVLTIIGGVLALLELIS